MIDSICILGGGTSGLLSALVIKHAHPEISIKVVKSDQVGIIGVGEGSTEHWNEFMKYIGVPFQTVIKECDATFKAGIMFRGWADEDYMHSIGPENDTKNGQYASVYGKLIGDRYPNKTFNPSLSIARYFNES
jgi:hypothetical protein